MSKSFYRKMIEEKGLIHEVIHIQTESNIHFIEMDKLVRLIENAFETEKQTILNTMSKIDFMNGDLLHYLTFLAKQYVKQIEKVLQYGK